MGKISILEHYVLHPIASVEDILSVWLGSREDHYRVDSINSIVIHTYILQYTIQSVISKLGNGKSKCLKRIERSSGINTAVETSRELRLVVLALNLKI